MYRKRGWGAESNWRARSCPPCGLCALPMPSDVHGHRKVPAPSLSQLFGGSLIFPRIYYHVDDWLVDRQSDGRPDGWMCRRRDGQTDSRTHGRSSDLSWATLGLDACCIFVFYSLSFLHCLLYRNAGGIGSRIPNLLYARPASIGPWDPGTILIHSNQIVIEFGQEAAPQCGILSQT
jgi:hypothetical protein